MPANKGVPRPDIALMNKARKGRNNPSVTKKQMEQITLEKVKAYDEQHDALKAIAKANGVELKEGWSLVELFVELKKAMPAHVIGKAGANALSNLTTTSSADASVKLFKILFDVTLDKTIETPNDPAKPANIIIFGKDDFGGVE